MGPILIILGTQYLRFGILNTQLTVASIYSLNWGVKTFATSKCWQKNAPGSIPEATPVHPKKTTPLQQRQSTTKTAQTGNDLNEENYYRALKMQNNVLSLINNNKTKWNHKVKWFGPQVI